VSVATFRVLLRNLYTAEVPVGEDSRRLVQQRVVMVVRVERVGGGVGGTRQAGAGGTGEGGGKRDEHKGAGRRQAMAREVFKATDVFQAEGLLNHCLKTFRLSLTLHTAVECLVWTHLHGPRQARALTADYLVQHGKTIQVRICSSVRVCFCASLSPTILAKTSDVTVSPISLTL